ncbi:MAG TPA: TetR family transcriptional regulator [Acidimicrobiales bacterium]|nr:TetR family transcriptional regulator [Acidimicrobiales bacterium]
MARLSRSESKARTRRRLIDEAERLFVERGYAATSLEQIAQAAEVTKGAIYGHFSSKEDLLLSTVEAAPSPLYPVLADSSRPLLERLGEFGRQMAASDREADVRGFAAWLEFLAALLRNDDARQRYADDVVRRLSAYAAQDPDEPAAGTTTFEAWVIGAALCAGLQLYGLLMPEVLDSDLRAAAMELLGGLYAPTPGR